MIERLQSQGHRRLARRARISWPPPRAACRRTGCSGSTRHVSLFSRCSASSASSSALVRRIVGGGVHHRAAGSGPPDVRRAHEPRSVSGRGLRTARGDLPGLRQPDRRRAARRRRSACERDVTNKTSTSGTRRNVGASAGLAIVLVIVLLTILAPVLAPQRPGDQFPDRAYAPPMRIHLRDHAGFRAPFVYRQVLDDRVERRFHEDPAAARPSACGLRAGGSSRSIGPSPCCCSVRTRSAETSFRDCSTARACRSGVTLIGALGALLLGPDRRRAGRIAAGPSGCGVDVCRGLRAGAARRVSGACHARAAAAEVEHAGGRSG